MLPLKIDGIQERLCVLAAECASALQTSSTAHSCNPPEALSQSEIVLSLRRICFTHHLQKWESYLTEIKIDPDEFAHKLQTAFAVRGRWLYELAMKFELKDYNEHNISL